MKSIKIICLFLCFSHDIPIGFADECFVGIDNDYDAKDCPTGMTKCLVVYESITNKYIYSCAPSGSTLGCINVGSTRSCYCDTDYCNSRGLVHALRCYTGTVGGSQTATDCEADTDRCVLTIDWDTNIRTQSCAKREERGYYPECRQWYQSAPRQIEKCFCDTNLCNDRTAGSQVKCYSGSGKLGNEEFDEKTVVNCTAGVRYCLKTYHEVTEEYERGCGPEQDFNVDSWWTRCEKEGEFMVCYSLGDLSNGQLQLTSGLKLICLNIFLMNLKI